MGCPCCSKEEYKAEGMSRRQSTTTMPRPASGLVVRFEWGRAGLDSEAGVQRHRAVPRVIPVAAQGARAVWPNSTRHDTETSRAWELERLGLGKRLDTRVCDSASRTKGIPTGMHASTVGHSATLSATSHVTSPRNWEEPRRGPGVQVHDGKGSTTRLLRNRTAARLAPGGIRQGTVGTLIGGHCELSQLLHALNNPIRQTNLCPKDRFPGQIKAVVRKLRNASECSLCGRRDGAQGQKHEHQRRAGKSQLDARSSSPAAGLTCRGALWQLPS